jgi:mono/diheme cytochrome c family protein
MRTFGKRSPRFRGMILALAAFAALGLAAGRAGAQDEESIGRGRVTYRVYCHNCHGDEARGDGRLASLLKVKPTDLTQLAHTNHGRFPVDKITKIIDGREEVLAHGDREMPVWGQVFMDKAGSEDDVRVKLVQLVHYLESIQAKSPAAKATGSNR